MRRLASVALWQALILACLLMATSPAYAEVEEIKVGGDILVRGHWVIDAFFDDNFPDDKFVEQRNRIHVQADFTEDVTAYIELQNYNIWGEDFSSTTSTAFGGFELNEAGNGRGRNGGDVDLYQAYIQMDNVGGNPLSIKFGRQELVYGREWLLGNNDTAWFPNGLSFDAVKVSYNPGNWFIDAFWAKLAETRTFEADADTDLYGIYAGCRAIEDWEFDLYWLYVRDAQDALGINAGFDGVTPAFFATGVRTDDTDEFHTLGLRVDGIVGNWNMGIDAAYQLGTAAIRVATPFTPVNLLDDGDYDAWGVDAYVNYTFSNVRYTPNLGVQIAYYSGDDDLTDDDHEAFNRVFSDIEYTEPLGTGEESNGTYLVLSGSANLSEKIDVGLYYNFIWAAEDDIDLPAQNLLDAITLGKTKLEGDTDIGHGFDLWVGYQYSEDLNFTAGYSHFFAGDGIDDATLVAGNGTSFYGSGLDDDDVDYFYLQASLAF